MADFEMTEDDVSIIKGMIEMVSCHMEVASIDEIFGWDCTDPEADQLADNFNSFARRFREWDEET